MSEQVLIVLISSSAGLIGALVGFAASFFSSKRTLDQAKEQRRIERAQELQAEVVPQLLAIIERFPAVREQDLTEYVDKIFSPWLEAIRNHPAYNRGSFTQEELDECFDRDRWRPPYNYDTQRHSNEWLEEYRQWISLHFVWLPRELLPLIIEFGNAASAAARPIARTSEGRPMDPVLEEFQKFQQKVGSRTTYKIEEVEDLVGRIKAATSADLMMGEVDLREVKEKTSAIQATARKALGVD